MAGRNPAPKTGSFPLLHRRLARLGRGWQNNQITVAREYMAAAVCLRPQAGNASHVFHTAWQDRAAFASYMKSREHAVSHSREPEAIMTRTEVRHEAFEVLMDSRAASEWLPKP